jgi:hypothetical protein
MSSALGGQSSVNASISGYQNGSRRTKSKPNLQRNADSSIDIIRPATGGRNASKPPLPNRNLNISHPELKNSLDRNDAVTSGMQTSDGNQYKEEKPKRIIPLSNMMLKESLSS